MAVPPIKIDVTADTTQAEASLKRVGDRAGVAGERVKAGATGMGAGAAQATRSFTVLGGQSRMLTQQLSQVAQQATATGQVGQALAVQAADIGLAFGTIGTIVGALAGIALPSLIAVFSGTEEKIKTVEERLDGLRGGFERVRSQQDALIGLRQSYVDAINNSQNILAANLQQEIELRGGILRVEQALFQQELSGMKRTRNEREAEIALIRERIDQEIAMLDLNGPGQESARRQAVNEITQRHIEQNRELFSEQRRLNTEIELMELEYERTQMAIDEATASMNEFDASIIRSKANAEALAAIAETMGPSVAGGRGTIQDPRARMRTELAAQLSEDEPAKRTARGGGAARQDTTESDLERVQEFLMSETEMIQSAHQERLEALMAAREAQLVTQEEYNNLEAELQQRHADKLVAIDRAASMAKLSAYAGAFGDLASLMQSENKRLQKIGEAAAIAQITLEGIQSASSAWQKGMQIGGPPAAALFAGLSAGKTAYLLSQVGGGGGGGASSVGGGVPSAGAATEEAGGVTQNRSLTLIGDNFNRKQAIDIAEYMNEGTDNGLIIRGRA